ncbi:hypothetical protein BH20BAC1_BH20BAC1_27330 [soil metagenome]
MKVYEMWRVAKAELNIAGLDFFCERCIILVFPSP